MKKLLIIMVFFLLFSSIGYCDVLTSLYPDNAMVTENIYLKEGVDADVELIIDIRNDNLSQFISFRLEDYQIFSNVTLREGYIEDAVTYNNVQIEDSDIEKDDERHMTINFAHSNVSNIHLKLNYTIINYTHERPFIYTYLVSDDMFQKTNCRGFNLNYYSPKGYYFTNLENLPSLITITQCKELAPEYHERCQERMYLRWSQENYKNSRVYFMYENEEEKLNSERIFSLSISTIYMIIGAILGYYIAEHSNKKTMTHMKEIRKYFSRKFNELKKHKKR